LNGIASNQPTPIFQPITHTKLQHSRLYTAFWRNVLMKFIPILIQAGIFGFESPAAEYKELGLSLDKLLISNPDATFFGLAQGESMVEAGIFDGDLLLVDSFSLNFI